jgi:hypothetical protein
MDSEEGFSVSYEKVFSLMSAESEKYDVHKA